MTISEKEHSIQLISFNIGKKLFGADILTIREIVRDAEIEALDKRPAFVEGVVRVRGEAIPVIDLKRRMTSPLSKDYGSKEWIMIANTDNYVAGFMVDAVSRIMRVDFDTILKAPDLVLEGVNRHYIRGVYDSEMGMLVVLDFEKLLAADEISELKQIDARL